MSDGRRFYCKTNKRFFRGGGGIRRSPFKDQVRYLLKGSRNNKLYKLYHEHARTSLVLTFFLFIENFGDLSPHGIHQLWGTYFKDETTCDNLWLIDVMLPPCAAAAVPLCIQWIRLNCHGTGVSRSMFGWNN